MKKLIKIVDYIDQREELKILFEIIEESVKIALFGLAVLLVSIAAIMLRSINVG